MTGPQETIFALSSAPGRAGVAVIRVSGPKAFDSFKLLINNDKLEKIPGRTLRRMYDGQGNVLDEALILTFTAPHSFTGEHVVEYHCHGSPAVIEGLLGALGRFDGHRLAQPGEFTRRAFENGRLDLTAAEAVADLIDAETQAQRQQALDQMGGALARLYDGWREELVRALAYIEAIIDFPDEDIPDSETAKAHPAIRKLHDEIAAHLNDNRRGERLREGIQVAVIGAPNAGKSSLVNALVQRDVAIVSPTAGTTRDIIEAHLNLGGYPVILADTAGLRPDQLGADNAHDLIESEGIRRALARAQSADIRLLVFDGTSQQIDGHTAALIDDKSILLFNKGDSSLYRHPREGGGPDARLRGHDVVEVSVTTGLGMDRLLAALTKKIERLMAASRETPSLTRARHRHALEDCLTRLNDALSAVQPELMAEDLRMAARALGRLTGRVDVEDLLDVIFRDFCIGK